MRLPYAKPESALQRAEELLEVNAPLEALNVLHHTLGARRSRSFAVITLEPLVLKFLNLAVTLRRGLIAREGLHYYKKLAQSTNAASVEKVVHYFLNTAESRVQDLRLKQSKESKQDGVDLISSIDDLETSDTFESVFTSLVDSLDTEDAQTDTFATVAPKRERDACTASIAFLWESYRMVLDLLRNNAKFEVLYQQTAKKAFEFCVKYNRKVEFRRLSDALNVHLQALNRPQYAIHRQQPSQAINLSDPDVLQRFLDTRFLQLQTATELELWQESFRSAEDICGLLLKAAEAIAPNDAHTPLSMAGLLPFSLLTNKVHGTKMMQMLVQYYEKLTQIFAFSDDPTFLAAAWNEYYSWTINAKIAVPVADEAQRTIASHVLLATLCSPVLPSTSPTEIPMRNYRKDRLTKMLGWPRVPDRATLLADAAKKNIISYAHPVVRQMYRVLEEEFHPLEVAQRMRPLLPQLQEDPELQRYIQPLANITAFKVLQHVSSIYSAMSFEHLLSLVSASSTPISLFELEKLIAQFNRLSNCEICISHVSNQFFFREKVPTLPPLDLFLQLPLFKESNEKAKKSVFELAKQSIEKEHLEAHARQEEIVKKKQQLENHAQAQSDKEKNALLQKQNEEREAIQKKLAEAARQKELEKLEQEQLEKKKNEVKQFSENLKVKAGIIIKSDSLNEIGKEELLLIEKAVNKRGTEALAQEMTQVTRKLEHIDRAIRKNEIPLLEKIKDQEKKRNRELAIELRKRAIEEAKAKHAQALAIMKRVQRMRKEAESYRGIVIETHKDEFLQLRQRAEEELEKAKQARRDQLREALRNKLHMEQEAQRKQKEAEKAEQLKLKQAEERKKKEEEERARLEQKLAMKEKEIAGSVWGPTVQKPAPAPVTEVKAKVSEPVTTTSDPKLSTKESTEKLTETSKYVPIHLREAQKTSERNVSADQHSAPSWKLREINRTSDSEPPSHWVPPSTATESGSSRNEKKNNEGWRVSRKESASTTTAEKDIERTTSPKSTALKSQVTEEQSAPVPAPASTSAKYIHPKLRDTSSSSDAFQKRRDSPSHQRGSNVKSQHQSHSQSDIYRSNKSSQNKEA